LTRGGHSASRGDALEHGTEAWQRLEDISSPRSLIIVFTHELIAGTLAKDAMASRWRLSLSLSAPTVVAELVRNYAIAGVLFFLVIVPIPPCLVAHLCCNTQVM